MIDLHPFRRTDLLALLLVFVVALIVRFSAFGTTEYYDDMAELSTRAQGVITTGDLPLTGQTAAGGVPNTPISLYLIAAIYKFSTDPLVISAIITALNVLGVLGVFLIGQRYGGTLVGAAAGLLYAVNPWAIYYSQRAFLPDFNAPFAIIGILLACVGFLEGRRWAQILCFAFFLIGVQVQLAGFALLPLIALIVLIGRRNIHPSATLIGLALGALTIAPFVAGLLSWDRSNLGVGGALAGRSLGLSGETLFRALQFTTGIGLGASPAAAPSLSANLFGLNGFPVGLWLILLVALALGLVDLWRRQRRLALLFTVWISLHLIAFSTNWISVPTYYLTTAAPGLLLVCGFGVQALWHWSGTRRALQAALVALIVLIVISQGFYWHTFTDRLNSDLAFYTPLRYLDNIRTQLAGYDDVVLIGGEGRLHRIWTWTPLLYGSAQCIRELTIAEGGLELLPAGRFAALFAPPTTDDATFEPFYRQGDARDLPLRAGEVGYKAYLYDQAPPPDTPALVGLPPFQFVNGVTLKGYALHADQVYLDWRLPAAQDAADQYFINFLNAKGDRIAARDTTFYPAKYWCNGDRAITWLSLPMPADATVLRVGMYRLMPNNSIVGQDVTDANGARLPWVDIDLPASP